MERRRKDGVRRPDYPSFSSTLLDAIYRSIDEADDREKTKNQFPRRAPQPISSTCNKIPADISEKRTIPPSINKPRRRRCTSSSSDASSDDSFSSSDPESISAAHPPSLRPIRTTTAVRSRRFPPAGGQIPAIEEKTVKKKEIQDSVKSRLRDLTNLRAPASPGSRIANFVNALFATKSKISAAQTPASSFSQSCLKKTPGSGKRTVRFCPMSVIVGDNCRPCAEKCVYGDDRRSAVRRAAVEEEDRRSDSSSDLFELKNLAAIGRFRNELPVYGSAISRGLTKIRTPYEEIGKRGLKEGRK